MLSKIEIPIFPLNGIILYPDTNLPLNIFEKKYLEMVDFSFTQKKYIGMIQTKSTNELYTIGCLGKISTYEETNDGRYIINLTGKKYFSIISEVKNKKTFRQVNASIFEPKRKENSDPRTIDNLRSKLINKYSEFSKQMPQNNSLDFLEKIDFSMIVKFFAMSLDFNVAEKQMLLETYCDIELANKLLVLLEYYSKSLNNSQTLN